MVISQTSTINFQSADRYANNLLKRCYLSNMDESKSEYKAKRVKFAEHSTLISIDKSYEAAIDLYYTDSDYELFKKEALGTVNRIRNAIRKRQADDMKELRSEPPIEHYIKSWKRLPYLLLEHCISPDEMIGIEHLAIGTKISSVTMSLRRCSIKTLLEEQDRQLKMSTCCDPDLLAETLLPFSEISFTIARRRAKLVSITE